MPTPSRSTSPASRSWSSIPATTRRCSTRPSRRSAGRSCSRRWHAAAQRAKRRGRDRDLPGGSGRGPTEMPRSVDGTGAVELITGGASLGQGLETAMAHLRRGARRRLPARAGHSWPDRSHRARHRGAWAAPPCSPAAPCMSPPAWFARRRWRSRPSCSDPRSRARHRGRPCCGATATAAPR